MTVDLAFTPTRAPRAHQWESLRRARGKRAFAYFHEMGSGKSKILVDELCQLYMEEEIDRALICAGSGSYEDWISKHLPESVPNGISAICHLWQGGHSVTEKKAIEYLANAPGRHLRVLVVNTEAMGSSQTALTVAENFVRRGRCLVAVDESTMIKREDSQRAAALIYLSRFAMVKRILTGSPVTKSPLDLWGQLKFLGVEQQFAGNFFSFRARFCETVKMNITSRTPLPPGQKPSIRSITKVTGVKNQERLTATLERHSHRVLKSECLDLPPKIYEVYRCTLTDEQRRMYKEMAQLATTEIESGTWASAKNAMGALAKMHQIILGHLVDESGEVHGIPTNRPRELADLIEETSGKVIVWCAYRRDVTLVIDELWRRFPGEHVVRYDGLVKPEDRALGKHMFQDGDSRFFVGTAASGGRGLTLTASSETIYYSNSHDLDHRMQSEDRNHRDGQTQSVTYVDMIAPNTVEERIVRLLRAKKRLAETTIGDEVTEWLEWMKQ